MDSADNRQVLSDAPRMMALSEALHALPPPEAAERLRRETDEIAARVLSLLNPGEAVDVLGHVPPERRDRIMAAAPGGRGAQWRVDLEYPESSVGRLMEAPLAVYRPETTVGEAIESLRELLQRAFITYVFVTEADGRLVGVLAFRELLFARRDQRLDDLLVPPSGGQVEWCPTLL
jgi:magnesium transporter